jgi:antitoxin (DNA-binding transcriptional repressor) of toxin-antitoxin stability system
MTRTRLVAQLSAKPRYSSDKNLEVLTKLTIKGSYSWSGIGYVAEGDSAIRKDGDRERTPGPWAYGFPLCHVIDNHGGTGAEQARLRAAGLLVEVEGGEEIEIAGVVYLVTLIRRGRDAWVELTTEEELIAKLGKLQAQQAKHPHAITEQQIADLRRVLFGAPEVAA